MTGGPTAQRSPAVDVVVATRNRPELLQRALRSILGQQYDGPIRVLLVHDQSEPDRSVQTAGPERSVVVLENSRRPGLAGARNTGILAASAPFLAFCDDDDEWLPGKLAAQVRLLDSDPDASLVSCGIRVCFEGVGRERQLDTDTIRLADLLRSRLTELHPSTFLMRREDVVSGFGLVEEEIPGSYAEDYEFLLRAARHGPVRILPAVAVNVHWHKQSYFTDRWDTIVAALTWLLQRYPEFEAVPAGAARITGQLAFASAARGDRRAAVTWARRSVRRNPREGRAYLALGVASGAVSADTVLRRLHARGRGI